MPRLVVLLCALALTACSPPAPAARHATPAPVASGGPAAPARPKPARPTPAWTFTATGDFGTGEATRQVLRAMARTGADAHLALGDLSYAGPDSEQPWCEMVTRILGEGAPFQLVAGNHEDDHGRDGHIREFTACLPDRMGSQGRYGSEYYFDAPGLARFILVAPDLTVDSDVYDYARGTAHERWLRDAVAGARTAGLPWTVVGMHKSCVSASVKHPCEIGQDLVDLLLELGVDLVVSGHDHNYFRSGQLAVSGGCQQLRIGAFEGDCIADDGSDNAYGKDAGTVFVVVGAATDNLYDVEAGDAEFGYLAAAMGANREPTTGFLRVRLTASRLRGRFVNVAGTSGFGDRFVIR